MQEWSRKFDLSKPEIIRALKYLARWVLYALIVWVIFVVSNLNIPVERAFIIPIITTLLTNVSLTVRKFMSDTTS